MPGVYDSWKAFRKGSGVTFKTTMFQCVAYKVMRSRGWTETEDDNCDVFWADVHSVGGDSGFEYARLADTQKVNHFPRHSELSRKDLMVKNLKRARKALEKEGRGAEFDFFPQTYILPLEYGPFVEEFRRQQGAIWIMKPSGRAQGRGIFLMDRLSQLASWKKSREHSDRTEAYVVSRYIDKPLLIGGRKFDLRIYALVLSYTPLHVYMHRGGFCRLSTGRYSVTRDNISELQIHVTNVAIQRKAEGYEPTSAMKWPIRSFRQHIMTTHGEEAMLHLFEEIQAIVLRSLLAVQRVITQDKHCFELYGYDILVDEDLKPWLIEVNASPSLSTDTAADHKLKFQMVDDCLTLVDVEGHFQGRLPSSYGGFDLVWDSSGPVRPHPVLATLLGCAIPEGRRNRKHMAP